MAQTKHKEMDMLHGGLAGKLILFALPLAFSSILQQLFNSADVAVVGRFAGDTALAAVGSCVALVGIFVNLIVGLSVGPNAVLALLIGQNNRDEINRTLHTVITFGAALGVGLMIVGWLTAKPILVLSGTPESVLERGAAVHIYLLSEHPVHGRVQLRRGRTAQLRRQPPPHVLPAYLRHGECHPQPVSRHRDAARRRRCRDRDRHLQRAERGHGDHPPHAGTTISRSGSDVCASKRTPLLRILQIGIPAGIQGAIFSISNVFIQSGINSFGENAIAGSSLALNFEYFTYDIANAFAQAAVTFTSQNYGAGDLRRCKKIFRHCMLFGVVFTEILSAVFMVWDDFFVSIYTTSSAVAVFAISRMRHVCSLEGLTATYEVESAALRGMGKSLEPAIFTVLGTVVFRLIWMATVFRLVPTFEMLMDVYVASWVFTGGALLIVYLRHMRKVSHA